MKHGFARIAVGIPRVTVADCEKNVEEICRLIAQADEVQVDVLVLPELSLTGVTCGDLFFQSSLLQAAEGGLETIAAFTKGRRPVVAVGLPIRVGTHLFDCAAVMSDGKILGVVPKTARSAAQRPWFSDASGRFDFTFKGETVPFGTDLMFRCEAHPALTIGVEIGEDLEGIVPPSALYSRNGATVLLRLAADPAQIGQRDRFRSMIAGHSARCMAVYASANAGAGESTTDAVYFGHGIIAENGSVLLAGDESDGQVCYCDVDLEALEQARLRRPSFTLPGETEQGRAWTIPFSLPQASRELCRTVDPIPFLPKGDRENALTDILAIQAAGLQKRLEAANCQTAVIGVSGGLDSTLALLVTAKAFDQMDRPRTDILGVTMPGFGTTDKTYDNAIRLMDSLGVTRREISIEASVLQHFADIGHDPQVRDTTYQNAQARERTQILMDLANQTSGLVVGTGNLSESALGWSTYGGDHLSMYAVNVGVPKTVVCMMVEHLAMRGGYVSAVSAVLQEIARTPISPELLPPDASGNTPQRTEALIGPYALHDFFLYYVVHYGFSPGKIVLLAEIAFAGRFERVEIKKWLGLFYRRFFAQQFKRSCMPDGPQVGVISLSPRGGWQMPSDAPGDAWLREFGGLE